MPLIANKFLKLATQRPALDGPATPPGAGNQLIWGTGNNFIWGTGNNMIWG